MPLFQMMVKTKQKGEKELFAKRERMTELLEDLRHRTEDFEQCSELDMIQQVLLALSDGPEEMVTMLYISFISEGK